MIRLGVVVALPAEARFFIEQFKLKQIAQRPFVIFHRDPIHLIVSGVGVRCAAMATVHLAATFSSNYLMNIGVAGHPRHTIGTLGVVSKLVDMTLVSKKQYYLIFLK